MPAKKTPLPLPSGFDSQQFDQLYQWLKAKHPDLSTDALVTACSALYQSIQITKGAEQAKQRSTALEEHIHRSLY